MDYAILHSEINRLIGSMLKHHSAQEHELATNNYLKLSGIRFALSFTCSSDPTIKEYIESIDKAFDQV